MGSWVERTLSKAAAGGPGKAADCGAGGPTFVCGKTRKSTWGAKQTCNPKLQHGEIKPQTTNRKHLWGFRQQQKKLPASQESLLERPTRS